jgi:hypothetical protein
MTSGNVPSMWQSEGEFRGGDRGTAFISGVTFGSSPVVYSNVDGMAIFEGDIALGPVDVLEQQLAEMRTAVQGGTPSEVARAIVVTGARFRWPDGIVPFEIDPALPNPQRVRDAIRHWEDHTHLIFPERTAASASQYPNFIRFSDAGGCWSFVGMQGNGGQTISLGSGCSTGNAIHEIGHAVGLWHEQSREDRDLFVTIHWQNIQSGTEHNFDQHITDGDDVGEYDYGSIMHYPRTAFSKNGNATITPVDTVAVIGQRSGLSTRDIAAIHIIYPIHTEPIAGRWDITGDRKADIVGFGDGGSWVSIGNGDGTFQNPQLGVANFAYDAGSWRIERHPRYLADVNGGGRADIVGFGDAGVWVSAGNGDGTFGAPQLVVANFAYNAGGWRVGKHPRYLADVAGDGRPDIVGFGDAGVWVSLNNGNGTFQNPQLGVANFAYNAGGWRVGKHPRYLADVTGDGRADIVGFGDAGVWVSVGNGDGTFGAPQLVVANFAYSAGGWRVSKHPRYLVDITGDGRADIVGFGDAGVWVSRNNGDGTFGAPQLVVANFAYNAGGWRVEKHPRFLADVTGDGRPDIVGFGDAGVWVSLNNGNGTFQNPQLGVANFAYNAGGWRVEKHPRFLADVTGDGKADIVGFGDAGVWVSIGKGDGTFQNPQLGVANFAYNAGGWRVEKHPRAVPARR